VISGLQNIPAPNKGSKAASIHSLRTIIYHDIRAIFCANIPANLQPLPKR